MTHDPLFIFLAVTMLAVLAVLLIGVIGFAKGGKFNAKNGNKLMQLRVLLQFVAIVAILIFVWIRVGN